METLSLNGEWLLYRAQEAAAVPATVPGCVHLDLMKAGEIADPFYRDNELDLFWIGETDWRYTRTFTISPSLLDRAQVRLVCHGLDTLATVALNGITVGQANNMFRTWQFDVKSHLAAGENTISIHFDAPMPFLRSEEDKKGKLPAWLGDHRLNSGAWLRKQPSNFGWDWSPRLVTSGIWRDIELIAFDARLSDVHIRQQHRPDKTVELSISAEAEVYSPEALTARFQVRLDDDLIAVSEHPLNEGRATAQVIVERPQLWWLNGMGAQPLYDVSIQLVSADGRILDETARRIGLRTLTLERYPDRWGECFFFAINGIPFFAKGANWIPADTFVSRPTRHDYEHLIREAAAVHMNMLRVWGGGIYEQDVFYELCDELGIAVWQDFMFACGTYPSFDAEFMANVQAEAEDNIRRLRHHACLALWCGNNELEEGLVGGEWTDRTMSWDDYGKLFDVLLPSVVQSLDPDRTYWPCSPHSPVGERTNWMSAESGDAHLWAVWHGREPFEWYRTCFHRFVSEFGFQSFPELATLETVIEPGDQNITSYAMEYRQRSGIGNSTIVHYLLDWFQLPTSFEATLWLSQILQGMAIKYAVEHWRRNMPRTMGALYWQLNDCWPGPSWSSIDSLGRRKALHFMAERFFAPLLISGVEDTSTGTVEIHVTSDLLEPQTGTVRWSLLTTDGTIIDKDQFNVTIPPRQNTHVKTLQLQKFIQALGSRSLLLTLSLIVSDQVSENLVLFTRPKHLTLVKPEIRASFHKERERHYQLELSTSTPTLWVSLTTAGRLGDFSDNFFHLMPGQMKVVEFTAHQDMTPEQVERHLIVQSLFDTHTQRCAGR